VIRSGNHGLVYFSRRQRRARSFFVVGAGRRTIFGIGLALVSPIGIASSGEDVGIMSQPIEQSFSSAKTLTHSESARFEVMTVERRS
jgi:hypothetical protein